MDSSKLSNIILDSDDDEMDDIIAEFAEEEGKEQVIQLSESEDEIDNLIEEFAAEIDDVDVEMGTTSEERATANDAIIGDRDCMMICDKNNDNKHIYSDEVSPENSTFKDTKESCVNIKSSSRNENFSFSDETSLSKITSDNATENENCVANINNPPIIILKCESLSSPNMFFSSSELSALTNHPINNVSKQNVPNKSTNQNHLEELKCDTINSVFSEVDKNCSNKNNGVLDVSNDAADNIECIKSCDKDRTTCVSSVEILEENSSLKETLDSIDISDIEKPSLAINNMSKPLHNMVLNNNSVIDIPESESFCRIHTVKSIFNMDTEVTVTPVKLNSDENRSTKSNQNLVDEDVILLKNSTCANNEYNRTNDVINSSERESHSKCIENLQSNDTKLIVQVPNELVNKDSSVNIAKSNCLKTVAEKYLVNTKNKTNSDTFEDAFGQNSDVNYSESQIISSSVSCESPDISSDVKIIDKNSVDEELERNSKIKDTEKNLMSCLSEKISSDESFLKHREKLIVEAQSFISTAYDSSFEKYNINSNYKREVMNNLELFGNTDKRTNKSEWSSVPSGERDLSKIIQEKTIEVEEQVNEIEEKTSEIEERTNETKARTNKITVEGSSDVNVIHQQESSILIESVKESALEILKSGITENSENNIIDSKEVLEKEDTKTERNKRILEISEKEFSCKRLKNDVCTVIDSNKISLDFPEDFDSTKLNNKEGIVYEVINVDIDPVDKKNQMIPCHPDWKIGTTKKTLHRIALRLSEGFVEKYYEMERNQMEDKIRKLKKQSENLSDVIQNLVNMVKELKSSQIVSFAVNSFKKVTYRTVGTNVKIKEKKSDEQKILNETNAEKIPEVIPDQKQQDVSPNITILNVSGNVSNHKQENMFPVTSIPKPSEIVSDQKHNVSPTTLTIPSTSGIISDQKHDSSSVLTVSKASEVISDQKKQNVPAVIISIPKTSAIISDQKKQGVSHIILTLPKAFKTISNQKQQKFSPVISIPKTVTIISGHNQENISHIKAIPKASRVVSNKNHENISVTSIPKAPEVVPDQNQENVPHIKDLPKLSGIDLPKSSSPSCINLSSSHGGASKLSSFIPTPLPYVVDSDRLVPYIEPSKPLPSSKPLVMPTAVTTATNCQIAAIQKKQSEQKGAMPNGVLHPLDSMRKQLQNVQPSNVPQQAFLPLQANSFKNITNHLTQGNIRRVMQYPSQSRQLQLLQMNSTDAGVNFNSAANDINKASAMCHKPYGPSISALRSLLQKDSQNPLYYQVPRFDPRIPARQTSHVPSQSFSMTMTGLSRVMNQPPNLANCHPTYVHNTASPVISHPLSYHNNSAFVNRHPMSYQPFLVPAHNNPLQLRHPPASLSNHNSLPVPYMPYLPSGHNTSEKFRDVLPIPIVKGSLKDNGSVIISWDLPSLKQKSDIAFYQLFSCQVKNPPESPPMWKSVGDVPARDLPIACTLNHFEENTYYCFTVRVVDKLKYFGPFSEPVTIYYSGKNCTSLKT